jgi:hypothetical protein
MTESLALGSRMGYELQVINEEADAVCMSADGHIKAAVSRHHVLLYSIYPTVLIVNSLFLSCFRDSQATARAAGTGKRPLSR